MAGTRIRFTRDDYMSMPDTWRGQLIEGDLVVSPSATRRHADLVMRLILAAARHLGADGAKRLYTAPADVVLDDANVFQPDVFVLASPNDPPVPGSEYPVPVWVAEVLSPSTASYDRGVKLKVYADRGVHEAWLVDPETETVTVLALRSGDKRTLAKGETAESGALPGFRVDLTRLFAA